MRVITGIIILLLLTPSCKKQFPEDDNISFRHPISRIRDGIWEIRSYTMDSKEVFKSVQDSMSLCPMLTIEFEHSRKKYGESTAIRMHGKGCSQSAPYWFDKSGVIWIGGGLLQGDANWDNSGPFAILNSAIWEVRKLDKNDLILTTHFEGTIQTLEAKRIR